MGTFGALHLVANGAIMVLLGNLCGIPFGRAITGRKDEAVIRAWRVAHSGNIMTGVSIIAPACRYLISATRRRSSARLRLR